MMDTLAEQWIDEGEQKKAIKFEVDLLQHRFGTLPEMLIARLNTLSTAQLDQLFSFSLDAGSLGEVTAFLNTLPGERNPSWRLECSIDDPVTDDPLAPPIPRRLPGNPREGAAPEWLDEPERQRLSTFKIEKRRRDWLLGRWTAKRLVQSYLAAATGRRLPLRRCTWGTTTTAPHT